MKWVLGFLVLVGLCVGIYWIAYPNYTYRYRLTVDVELDGEVHSGSSVIEVTWHGHPNIPEAGSYSATIKGEAPLVDLGARGALVATLITGEGYGRASDGAWGALWIAPRAFGFGTSVDELPHFLKMRGKRELQPDDFPRFVWFPNPQDPLSGQKIGIQNLASVLDTPAHLVGLSVEITDAPVSTSIRQKLPWIKSLENQPPGTPPLHTRSGMAISRQLFIGDASEKLGSE